MTRILLSISLVAMTTLLLELLLTRVFDVILYPNMAYMVIACAMFAFGLAGIYATLRPLARDRNVRSYVSGLCFWYSVSTLSLLPILNVLPFDYGRIAEQPVVQLLSFLAMYVALVMPFFLSGLVFATVFSSYAEHIQALYFWDLTGAGVGCVLILPLLPPIGAGGALFCAAALGLLASGLFSPSSRWSIAAPLLAAALVVVPFARSPSYFEFTPHLDKRGIEAAKRLGKVELSYWDPISKIDIVDQTVVNPETGEFAPFSHRKHIAYDGGTQSSHIYPFDGDYGRLRADIDSGKALIRDHFWHRGVLASHYLMRDSGQRVLIIGSAGGQETKAALMNGAAEVDAVELVSAVVDLGKNRYAEYNGNLFNDPRVTAQVGEGRSFLRATSKRYDIIQIHSNHTSSSIAAGTGAMATNYLQTADAYREYFTHLSERGILHINHFVYPRMITTAALAWRQMGRTDFEKHVVVFGMVGVRDTLPTFLVKMTPWTEEEVEELRAFFARTDESEIPFELVQDPLAPERSFLSPVFFSGEFPPELARSMDYRIRPTTDNQPFFNFLRKRVGEVEPNDATFMNLATALVLNSQLRGGIIPMDVIHLVVTGVASLVLSIAFIVIPLYFSTAGNAGWPNRYAALIYFSCLGAGFVILELVFIQIFMKLIGFPVHTYAVVLFTMLVAAGLGSLSTRKLAISVAVRWQWPFVVALVYGAGLCLLHGSISDRFLASPEPLRALVAAGLIFPLGFVLGMPFPLGILAIKKHPTGAIAWAWGLNGLFTVIGGLASVLLGIYFGFQITILVALALYGLAFWAFGRMRAVSY